MEDPWRWSTSKFCFLLKFSRSWGYWFCLLLTMGCMQAEICCTNLWMEMLIVIHMMAALALTEANTLMIPKNCYTSGSGSGNGVRVVSTGLASLASTLFFATILLCLQETWLTCHFQTDCRRDAVDLLLKASGYLEFCVREILIQIPPDIKYEAQIHKILVQAWSH